MTPARASQLTTSHGSIMTALARSAARLAHPPEPDPTFLADVTAGLSAQRKRIPPKYFYDAAGSQLFEQITRLPEYYPTRTELKILSDNAEDIVKVVLPNAALVEFGSGSATKVRVLLRAAPELSTYVPVDISGEFLNGEAERLRREFPGLTVLPVAADFTKPFALPAAVLARPRMGFFPGSTIGNFEPHEAAAFMRHAARILGAGAELIVGADLVKDTDVLHAAYNDAAGVTARFNKNLLVRINRELGGDFDLDRFEHHAFYNREMRRIEMHLASCRRQKVRVAGRCFEFRAGETIHTENSYKYSIDGFVALARGAGWVRQKTWTDSDRLFSVHQLTTEDES
jgi:dimethylhistidine N-methyltransferase